MLWNISHLYSFFQHSRKDSQIIELDGDAVVPVYLIKNFDVLAAAKLLVHLVDGDNTMFVLRENRDFGSQSIIVRVIHYYCVAESLRVVLDSSLVAEV